MTPTETKTTKHKGQLPGIPDEPQTDLERAALAFRQAKEAVEKAKEKLGEAACDVITEMRKAKRFLIPVDGGTLELKHEAAKEIVKFIPAKGK